MHWPVRKSSLVRRDLSEMERSSRLFLSPSPRTGSASPDSRLPSGGQAEGAGLRLVRPGRRKAPRSAPACRGSTTDRSAWRAGFDKRSSATTPTMPDPQESCPWRRRGQWSCHNGPARISWSSGALRSGRLRGLRCSPGLDLLGHSNSTGTAPTDQETQTPTSGSSRPQDRPTRRRARSEAALLHRSARARRAPGIRSHRAPLPVTSG